MSPNTVSHVSGPYSAGEGLGVKRTARLWKAAKRHSPLPCCRAFPRGTSKEDGIVIVHCSFLIALMKQNTTESFPISALEQLL